jgi:hypothetical protein
MTYPHNPQTYLNGYISMMRNMFLTSSVALGTMGFSNRFKEFEIIIKIVGTLIMGYSILYGYTSAKNYSNYIKFLEEKKELVDVYEIQLPEWKNWIKLTYLYMILLVIVVVIILFRKILKL